MEGENTLEIDVVTKDNHRFKKIFNKYKTV